MNCRGPSGNRSLRYGVPVRSRSAAAPHDGSRTPLCSIVAAIGCASPKPGTTNRSPSTTPAPSRSRPLPEHDASTVRGCNRRHGTVRVPFTSTAMNAHLGSPDALPIASSVPVAARTPPSRVRIELHGSRVAHLVPTLRPAGSSGTGLLRRRRHRHPLGHFAGAAATAAFGAGPAQALTRTAPFRGRSGTSSRPR